MTTKDLARLTAEAGARADREHNVARWHGGPEHVSYNGLRERLAQQAADDAAASRAAREAEDGARIGNAASFDFGADFPNPHAEARRQAEREREQQAAPQVARGPAAQRTKKEGSQS